MSVSAIGASSSAISPAAASAGAGDSPSNPQVSKGGGPSKSSGPASITNISQSCQSIQSMSTQNFVSLSNQVNGQDPMMETIKKLLEMMIAIKMIEQISKSL